MTKNINTQAMSSTSDTPKYKRKRRKKRKRKVQIKASKPTSIVIPSMENQIGILKTKVSERCRYYIK